MLGVVDVLTLKSVIDYSDEIQPFVLQVVS